MSGILLSMVTHSDVLLRNRTVHVSDDDRTTADSVLFHGECRREWAENIRLDINASHSESTPGLGGERTTGWLAQPEVYLHDLFCGFQP